MRIQVVSDFAEDFTHERRFDHQYRKNVYAVIDAARELGYECEYFGGVNQLIAKAQEHYKFDNSTLFLNLTAGLIQDSRKVQAPVLLELLNANYTGSDPFAHALANNKFHSKLAVDNIKVCKIAKDALATKYRHPNLSELSLPLVVKPNCEGGSIGIKEKNLVRDRGSLKDVLEDTMRAYGAALVEEYVVGIDATCLLIGNGDHYFFDEVLLYKTDGRFVQNSFIRDRGTKHNARIHSTKHLLQSVTSDRSFCDYVKETSKKIFKAIGCSDVARIDYRITEEGELYFLEINSLPALSPSSPYVAAIQEMGLSFIDLVGFLIKSARCRLSI